MIFYITTYRTKMSSDIDLIVGVRAFLFCITYLKDIKKTTNNEKTIIFRQSCRS